MPGHVKLGKSGEPDPDPTPYLVVSLDMKRYLQSMLYLPDKDFKWNFVFETECCKITQNKIQEKLDSFIGKLRLQRKFNNQSLFKL